MTEIEELEEKLKALKEDIERIKNMTLGDVVQELGLSLWEWAGELAFRLSEYADYSLLEPTIPSSRVIRRTSTKLKDVPILTVYPQFREVGEGTRRRRGGLVGMLHSLCGSRYKRRVER